MPPFESTAIRSPKEEALLGLLLMLFVCRAILASAIVPPWQGPDEPVHFVVAQVLAIPDVPAASARPELERQTLESMGRHRWWEPYGGRTPSVLTSFTDATTRLGVGVTAQPLYYGVASAVLRVAEPATIDAAYWRLRVLSISLTVVTLALAWAGTRLLFGTAVAAGSTAIAALHPQLLLTAINVNPDALLNVWGAFMWWQVARVVRRHRTGMSLLLVAIAATAALLTKRSAVPLGGAAVIVLVFLMIVSHEERITHRIRHRSILLVLTALTVCALAVGGGWLAFSAAFRDLGVFWWNGLDMRRPLDARMLSQAAQYLRISIDYAWLVAGWLRFPAPEPWLWVTRTLTVGGFASAAVLMFRSPELRRPLAIAWLFVIVQAATVIGWGFLTLSSPQGRYLFPVTAPATALLWLGLRQATPAQFRPYSAPALVALLAVLDATGFTAVLIPAYLPWG